MNCNDVKPLLIDHFHLSLSSVQKRAVDSHLSECSTCRDELRGLSSLLQLLDSSPAPSVHVDVNGIYQQTAERERRQAKRWRRVAIIVSSVAASLVAMLLWTRIEVRWEKHQFVIRWSDPIIQQKSTVAASPRKSQPVPNDELRHMTEQIATLQEWVEALADDAQQEHHQHRGQITQLQNRLKTIQASMQQLRVVTRQELTALYEACFAVTKGEIP